MNDWVPVALACGHLLQGQAMYEMPAEGSGEPALVECPRGCGMVEFVLPIYLQNRQRGNVVEVSLGYLEAGDNIDVNWDS